MARFVKRAEDTPAPADGLTEEQRIEEAFQLYMQLSDKLTPLFTAKEIATRTGLPERCVARYASKEGFGWHEIREKQKQQIITRAGKKFHLRVKTEGRQKKRLKQMSGAIEHLADVVAEVRIYNHKIYALLMAPCKRAADGRKIVSKKGITTGLLVEPANRSDLHHEWLTSLDKLLSLFGVETIKALASEMLSNQALKNSLAPQAPNPPPPTTPPSATVNVYTANPPPALTAQTAEQLSLTDNSYELVMRIMTGETKINGPLSYTGPQETSVIDGVEDAIVEKPGRPDSEG